MPTIQIHSVYPGNNSVAGHAWIQITNTDGRVESYGFYPAQTELNGPGDVKDIDADTHALPDNSSAPINISEAQAQKIRDFAAASELAHYDIWGGDVSTWGGTNGNVYNCATWAANAVWRADIDVRFPVPVWIPWWTPSAGRAHRSLWDAEGWNDNGIDPNTNNAWRSATAPRPRDPLAIDLDGDCIETVGIPTNGTAPILFDHDADNVRTGTGWLQPDDAWLVLDRDGNGSIDSGRELFGVDTVITVSSYMFGATVRNAYNGFEALRQLDVGSAAAPADFGDNVFDSRHAAFTQVRLLRDPNPCRQSRLRSPGGDPAASV